MIVSFKLSDLKPLSSYDQFMHKIVHMLSRCSHVQLFAPPWTVARQAPPSMEFSRQEYWSGLPFPPPGYLPDPEIEPASLVSPALAGRFFTTNTTWEDEMKCYEMV